MRTALVDHAHGLLQRQRAAGPGGGHFADAVAADRDRPHSAALERAGQGDLHGEQRRLRDFGQGEPIAPAGGALSSGENRFAAAPRIERIDLDQRLAKLPRHRCMSCNPMPAHCEPLPE